MSTLTAKRSLFTHLAPYQPVSDRYRSLRNMLETMRDRPLQIIAVTSAEARAGKTTTAVNLAIAFAQGGKRVLLIDGHLNRPALHDIFAESNLLGLSAVLLSGIPLAEAVRDVGIPQLSVLPAGPRPSRCVDPLESAQMTKLLERARNDYDYVLLDAPALLDATDASTLAARSDGVLWVVHAHRSRRQKELEAKKLAERMSLTVVGCVLNGGKLA